MVGWQSMVGWWSMVGWQSMAVFTLYKIPMIIACQCEHTLIVGWWSMAVFIL